jgi:cytidylate kinase
MTPHTYLEHGITILQTKLASPGAQTTPVPKTPAHPFITISRESCAGATTLGRELLRRLDREFGEGGRSWMFLDKDLLNRALTHHHLPGELAEYLPEDRVSEMKGLIGELVGLHPPLWQLEQHVSDAIQQIALLGRVIFAGRAAHLITRELRDGFHIRLVAPMRTRIERLMAERHCDAATAEAELSRTDNARRRYVQTHFGQDIDDPHDYDLVINTDRVSPATAADLVLGAMRDRFAASADTEVRLA